MDIHQNSNTLGLDENRLELLKNANSKIGLSDTKIKNIVFVYTFFIDIKATFRIK